MWPSGSAWVAIYYLSGAVRVCFFANQNRSEQCESINIMVSNHKKPPLFRGGQCSYKYEFLLSFSCSRLNDEFLDDKRKKEIFGATFEKLGQERLVNRLDSYGDSLVRFQALDRGLRSAR